MSERELEKRKRIAEGKKKRKQNKESKPLTPEQKKLFNVLTAVVMLVAVSVFVYSGWQLYTNWKEYKDGQNAYESWQDMFPTMGEAVEQTQGEQTREDQSHEDQTQESSGQEITSEPEDSTASEEATETETFASPSTGSTQETSRPETTQGVFIPDEPSTQAPVQDVDWVAFYDQMKAMNPDYIGWIIIADTKINYPMVQSVDNDYYLYRMFDGTDNRAGSLFADYRCEDVFRYRNTIIYGHNRYDGSMFANLRKYEADWFYNSHQTFYIYTEDGPVLYQIFSIYVTDPGSDTYVTRFSSDEAYVEWLNERYELSRVKPNVVLDAETDIVTLSTCVNNSTQRLVVHAKRMN